MRSPLPQGNMTPRFPSACVRRFYRPISDLTRPNVLHCVDTGVPLCPDRAPGGTGALYDFNYHIYKRLQTHRPVGRRNPAYGKPPGTGFAAFASTIDQANDVAFLRFGERNRIGNYNSILMVTIPEPAGLLLVAAGAGLLARRRREN